MNAIRKKSRSQIAQTSEARPPVNAPATSSWISRFFNDGISVLIAASMLALCLPVQAQQPEQQCYLVVEPVQVCDGNPFRGRVAPLPAWAPNPAYITRIVLWDQADPFPASAGGIWTITLDPGSVFINSSLPHYPLSQTGTVDKNIVLAKLELRAGRTMFYENGFSPPVAYRPGDGLMIDTPCTGGMTAQAVWSVCWIKP